MKRFLQLLITMAVLCGWAGAYAAPPDSLGAIPAYTDTISYVRYLNKLSTAMALQGEVEQAAQYAGQALGLARSAGDEEGASLALVNMGNAYAYKGNSRKALGSFIRSLKLKSSNLNHKRSEKLYYNIAVAFARVRQYPLALKYFHKAAEQRSLYDPAAANAITPVSAGADDSLYLADSAMVYHVYDDLLEVTSDEHIIVDRDTILFDMSQSRKDRAILTEDIIEPFDDGKDAIAYGLLLHIKQPVAGSRKAFKGINGVGHMFVTLVKFNADSGYVSRTFGFYPDKDYLLSATPLLPVSTSVFKDDGDHDWDEMLGTFVSKRKFNRVLRMVKRFGKRKYNLNKNNCTDFGLVIAGIAGIKIKETKGSWPLGSGNNPANAGQSVREGKVEQLDKEQLFIYPPPPDAAP